MSEEPENVKKWLESAEKEIVQLEGKETWEGPTIDVNCEGNPRSLDLP
jgi:hypothetical protein